MIGNIEAAVFLIAVVLLIPKYQEWRLIVLAHRFELMVSSEIDAFVKLRDLKGPVVLKEGDLNSLRCNVCVSATRVTKLRHHF